MSSEHNTPSYDDINTKSLALIGLFTVILVFVVMMATQIVYFRYEQAEFQRKVIQNENVEMEAVIAAQKARLRTIGPAADPESGAPMTDNPETEENEIDKKSIPISEAMEMVIANYQSEQERK